MNSMSEHEDQMLRPRCPVTLIIIDDEREICDALETLFEANGRIDVLAVGYSGEDAERLAVEHNPQVILLDLHFPEGISGIEAIRRISSNSEIESKILVYTISAKERTIFEAIKAGAHSYVWKDEEYVDLEEAALATARGEAYASPAIAQMVLGFFETLNRENYDEFQAEKDQSSGC